MNQQARREYSSNHLAQIKKFERIYLRKIFNALRMQINGFTDIFHERGIDAATRQLDRYLLNNKAMDVIRDMYINAGLFFARKTYREIRSSVKEKAANFGFNDEWTQAITAYLQKFILNTVSNITDETKKQILGVLEKAINEGWGIEKISSELKSPEIILWRARLIARTELAKAAHTGRKASEDTSDFETEKEWIAANDDRTRDSHRLIDGEVIDTEARFEVPRKSGGVDMMEGPGDPTASIENLANCRCSMAFRAKRNEQGRLIPKAKRITIIQPGLFNPKRTIITV